MKFEVAGREVDFRPAHVLFVLSIIILLILVLALVSVLATFALTGSFTSESFLGANVDVLGVFSLITAPVLAFLLLRFSGIAKMKNDGALCRSLAAGRAIINIGLALLAVIASFAVGLYTKETLLFSALALAGNLLSACAEAIIMYLWLLFFLAPGKGRAMEAASKAGIFAVVYFIIQGIAIVLLSNASDNLVAVALDYGNIRFILFNFIFAFPLLYSMKEKEDPQAYKLFAALIVGAALMYSINSLMTFGGWSWVVGVVESIVELSIIYALSKKDILKTF
jgi:hypothetical protein